MLAIFDWTLAILMTLGIAFIIASIGFLVGKKATPEQFCETATSMYRVSDKEMFISLGACAFWLAVFWYVDMHATFWVSLVMTVLALQIKRIGNAARHNRWKGWYVLNGQNGEKIGWGCKSEIPEANFEIIAPYSDWHPSAQEFSDWLDSLPKAKQ